MSFYKRKDEHIELLDRKNFVGYTIVETRRGGRRYVPALPNGDIYVYDGADGFHRWTPLNAVLKDHTLRPVTL